MNLNWVQGSEALRIGKPNDMLLRADISAAQARREIYGQFIADEVGLRIVERVLANPVFRPLLELELNGCTGFQAARLLLSEALVRPVSFKARAQLFRSRPCEALELTPLGNATLWDEQEGLEDNRWFALLRGSIVGYSCIDDGSGICPTRDFLETALELPDLEILKRCVVSSTGERQFVDVGDTSKPVGEEQRAQASHWWSIVEGVDRSGRIVDLST